MDTKYPTMHLFLEHSWYHGYNIKPMKIFLLIMFVLMALGYAIRTKAWIKTILNLNNDDKVSHKLLEELGINKRNIIILGIEHPIFMISCIIAFFYVLNH